MAVQLSKKVCLLGDFAVGKTSLVRRFVYNLFDDKYISTIGVKVSRKAVMASADDVTANLTLMLWDLAGGTEFTKVQTNYFRSAAGAILVCDITRPDTFDTLIEYRHRLFEVSPNAKIIIAANKSDLVNDPAIPYPRLEELSTSLQAPYLVTSAKSGQNTEQLFLQLGQ
ncbi:MAG: Rab family GTPase, partial [Chloroflexota bacterium]